MSIRFSKATPPPPKRKLASLPDERGVCELKDNDEADADQDDGHVE